MRESSTVQRRWRWWLILAFEFSPASPIVRFGSLAWIQAKGAEALAGAVWLGIVTLIIESGAALAAARLVSESGGTAYPPPRQGRAATLIRAAVHPLDCWLVRRGPLSTPALVSIALLGGPGAIIWLTGRERDRTRSQHQRVGLKVAVGLASVAALQGALVVRGLVDPGSFTSGVAVLALVAVPLVGLVLRRLSDADRTGEEPPSPPPAVCPDNSRYGGGHGAGEVGSSDDQPAASA